MAGKKLRLKAASEFEIKCIPKEGFVWDGQKSINCPLCHVLITKNLSLVVRIPAMVPRTKDGIVSLDTGEPYYLDRRTIRLYPKKYAHTHCWEVYSSKPAEKNVWLIAGTTINEPYPKRELS